MAQLQLNGLLKRTTDYQMQRRYIKKINFNVVKDHKHQLNAFEGGEADITDNLVISNPFSISRDLKNYCATLNHLFAG